MITAERLEELIKQGATIYISYFKEFETIKLCEDCEITSQGDLWFFENRMCAFAHKEQLFETKERVEWHCKMTAERTERFEPPMWEDIEKDYEFSFIKDGFLVTLDLKKEKWLTVTSGICLRFDVLGCKVTKENYIKACEIVRDLFNRGNK